MGRIRPKRIAEIGRTPDEGVGCHGSPDGIGQFRGGFNHDGGVSCPGDNETEFIGLQAKVGFEVENQWIRKIPERGRKTGKIRAPTRGSRQIINGPAVTT